ncbi:type IV secretion system protein [Klebsiella pneumoniae]|uniref:type IV secretion system protein n=1 Tax=Klebsiella pneumoniae TaxID=573 RepID=UPI001D0DB0A0|nr:type IV secretion system protein [Klebsiella pneumoniae]
MAGGDPWKWVDELWEKVQQVAAYLMSKDTSKYVKTDGAIIFINICWRIIALLTNLSHLAEVTIKILTITAPLFIICLSFGFLRQMFNSWLQLIFAYHILVLWTGN